MSRIINQRGSSSPETRSRVDGFSESLTALQRAHEVSIRLATVGFDWPDIQGVFDKIDEERSELVSAMASGDPREILHEYGDILMATANLGRFLGLDPEVALAEANTRFEERFRKLEALAVERGIVVEGSSIEALEELWQEVKRAPG